MLLHASSLAFKHPHSGAETVIEAAIQPEFERVMGIMGWQEMQPA